LLSAAAQDAKGLVTTTRLSTETIEREGITLALDEFAAEMIWLEREG
jgi:hypothetical protein